MSIEPTLQHVLTIVINLKDYYKQADVLIEWVQDVCGNISHLVIPVLDVGESRPQVFLNYDQLLSPGYLQKTWNFKMESIENCQHERIYNI